MNQEKELLEKVKEQVAKMKGFRSWKDLSEACGEEYREKRLGEVNAFHSISQRYVNELLKLREPKWISVDERLPENDTPVLVLFGTTAMGGTKWHQTVSRLNHMKRFNGEFDWTKAHYWTPLPEPPKTLSNQ